MSDKTITMSNDLLQHVMGVLLRAAGTLQHIEDNSTTIADSEVPADVREMCEKAYDKLCVLQPPMPETTQPNEEDIHAQLASLRERITRLEQKELVSTPTPRCTPVEELVWTPPASADPPWYVIAYTYHGEIMNLRGPYPSRGAAEDAARDMYIYGWATIRLAPEVQS